MLRSTAGLASWPHDWEEERSGIQRPGKQALGVEVPGNSAGGAGPGLFRAGLCSDAICAMCGSGLKAREEKREGERGARPFVSYEREGQMRRDNSFNAVLLLYKSALRVGRKGFFLFVVICLRELETRELSRWTINGEKITFR